jgi:tRNA nucleotidyltransferase (CCA-adding enzyme)
MKIYRVGGSVRDELLGRPVADRDYVVVGATPEAMRALGFRHVGRDFPVFLHPQTHDEYALARTERKSGRGHRGFVFHAAPEVTLEEDLARRDLTINAMARDEDGRLVDPFGGARDLEQGVLRHVGPAFAEDPLRVLRVARFAARFGFSVAPETLVLMRAIAAGGELATLSAERVWQELSRALMERRPSRFIAVLRDCGALGAVLPEVDALCTRSAPRPGERLLRALDAAAAADDTLPVRYAVLAGALGANARSRAARAERLSRRVHAPVDCRDLARVAARLCGRVERAPELSARETLDLLIAADAVRRPERFQALLRVCALWHFAEAVAAKDFRPATELAGALAAMRQVEAGRLAAQASGRDVARRVRAARLDALRRRRRTPGA